MSNATPDSDYPLSEVPSGARKGLFSTAILLFGFTFFTATMWAGGSVGVAFDFSTMLLVLATGNLLLGVYAAVLGYIAAKTGLNTALMSRYAFGDMGSKLSDFILGFTQIGWYAWGTATVAIVLGIGVSLVFQNMALGGVIAAAMVTNIITAGLAGASVPLAFDRMNLDPAVASSIFVTMITDSMGFFAFLGLATAAGLTS